MNTNIKLAIAFAAGIGVTALFIFFTNNELQVVEKDVVENTQVETESTSTDQVMSEDVSEETEETPTQPAPQTYTPPAAKPYVPPATTKSKYPYSAVVRYDGKFFTPEEVVIIQGGTVVFKNDSKDKDMWIASNYHPRHAVYPEQSDDDCNESTFDQCESVGPGGLWSFKFNVQGGWFYHNENDTIRTGKVRVLTEEEYDKEF